MSIFNSIGLAAMRLALLATAMCMSSMSYADDSVYEDPSTKLMWMRCSIGQTWIGSDCKGEAIEITWQDAMDYHILFNKDGFVEKHDWRLPTVSELSTLRRCSNGWGHLTKDAIEMTSIPKGTGSMQVPYECADGSSLPTLDTKVFPNTSTKNSYWSSSPYASYNHLAVLVDFLHGGIGVGGKSGGRYVRLVRYSGVAIPKP